MAKTTKIEWTDATWNPITGCSVVSPGCTNCYAMRLAGTRQKHHPSRKGLTRDTKAGPVWTGEVRFNGQWLHQPLRWQKPRMIFVCAHGDIFADGVPDEWIDRVFVVMAGAPQHTYQVLTKRSQRMREYLSRFRASPPDDGFITRDGVRHNDSRPGWPIFNPARWPLPNVWLGVSVEDQARADERIPDLLATPAAVRWISAEPLLGPVDLTAIDINGDCEMDALSPLSECELWERHFSPEATHVPLDEAIDAFREAGNHYPPTNARPSRLDWVVVGGESGPGARPMHPDWARSLRDQCAADGVPFFFKQWGEFNSPYDRERDDPDWRQCAEVERRDPKGRWLNRAGGHGFHGEHVVRVSPVGKKRAGRLLDGIEHNAIPEAL